MKTCANCDKPAVFEYMSTLYCDSHLPRFLTNRNGLSELVQHVVPESLVNEPAVVVPDAADIEEFINFVEASEVVAEEEPARPAPKKPKPTPKAVTPSE